MKKYFLNLLIASASCGLFIFSSCSKDSEASSQEKSDNLISISTDQLKHISLDTAKAVNQESDLILTGKVAFDEDKVAKVFPLVSGNVLKVNVSLGDPVKKGDVLAVIRSGDVSDLQNKYQVAQSGWLMAKKNLDVAEELLKTSVNSEKDVLNAQNEFKKVQGEVNSLKEQLSILGASASETNAEYKVVAPVDGYVVEKNISENMEIRSDNSANIFTVSSLDKVWVLADVYESDLSKIKTGDEVEINTIAYEGKVFKGAVSQIANMLDPQTKTLKARIVMDNRDALLKPEMFATVKVHLLNPGKIIEVPSMAVVFENNHYFVMVKHDENTYERREVQPGEHSDAYTYIHAGIKEGEIVVSSGSLLAANNNF